MSRFAYNGVHYVSWRSDEYATVEALASVQSLADTNANWAGLLTTWYQPSFDSTSMAPDDAKTPSDEALQSAIGRLHENGLKIMLKPHVDAFDGSWRGTFQPTDLAAWFTSYGRLLARYAELAESLHVEALCIGTEFAKFSGKPYRRFWTELVSDIRTRYSGLLTYAANAADTTDEFARVTFWDYLDLIGLDAYFPLNKGWAPYVPVLRRLADSLDKPVIFTEIGYRSIGSAAKEPWNHKSTGPADLATQADCYRAFFDAWTPHAAWMQGAFWWNWPAGPTDSDGTDYSPRDKPAARVLTNAFDVTPERARARVVEELRGQVQRGEYNIDPLAISKALIQRHLRRGKQDD